MAPLWLVSRVAGGYLERARVFGLTLCMKVELIAAMTCRVISSRNSATARTFCVEGSRWCLSGCETSRRWKPSRSSAPSARTSTCTRRTRLRVSQYFLVVLDLLLQRPSVFCVVPHSSGSGIAVRVRSLSAGHVCLCRAPQRPPCRDQQLCGRRP